MGWPLHLRLIGPRVTKLNDLREERGLFVKGMALLLRLLIRDKRLTHVSCSSPSHCLTLHIVHPREVTPA
jgi:hypothetical protein